MRVVDRDSTFTATAARDARCVACSTTAKPPVPNGALFSEHAPGLLAAQKQTHRWSRRAHTHRLCCLYWRRQRRRCAVLPELLGPTARHWLCLRRPSLPLRSRRASATAQEAPDATSLRLKVKVHTANAEPRSTSALSASTLQAVPCELRRWAALEGSSSEERLVMGLRHQASPFRVSLLFCSLRAAYDTRHKRLMGSADPNPAWTRAPWAGVPQPASLTSGVGARAAPLQAQIASASIGGKAALVDAARMPPPPPRLPSRQSSAAPDNSDWQPHFNAAVDVPVGQDVFRVYMTGSSGPLVLVLHGAGCTALSFAAAAPALAAAASCRVAAVVRVVGCLLLCARV